MATTAEKTIVTVETNVNAPVEKVWKLWTEPHHIVHWMSGADHWHTTRAENNLVVNGTFVSRMEAKDGSAGFDFSGNYVKIEENKKIEYKIDDGRQVYISFIPTENGTNIRETFETESENSVEMQQHGWQNILDNFKKYAESNVQAMHFDILINAPVEKVYETMIDEKKYSEWTKEFNPTSHYKGSWEKGSKIVFIGTDQDGNQGGMVSHIKENIPNKFISIEHGGVLKNDEEITSGTEVDAWAGALENYTFKELGNKTFLSIDVDSNDEFKSYFEETWPKALNRLKEICES